MERKLTIILCSSSLALVGIASICLGSKASGMFASDNKHEHTSSCLIHHYEKVEPTKESNGVKEYWICCADPSHEVMLENPNVGNIVTATHEEGFEIEPNDTRYIDKLLIDSDVILEAEDGLLNTNNYSNDSRAHGGAYGLGFDDCGQGMYYRYFAYEEGVREVEVAYATGCTNPYMAIYVNGVNQGNVTFSENTNWFGDNGGKTAIATASINVNKGWNEIYLIKDEVGGQYAQVDYIKVKGTGKDYTGQSFDKTVYSYKLEAGAARWHWSNSSIRPSKWDRFSMGYGLGSMDNPGDGVEFNIKATYTGKYKVRLVYGQPNDVQVNVFINDELVNEGKKLTNASTAWNDPQPDNSGITIDMVEGETYKIDYRRTDTWYNPDYLLLELDN